MNWSILVVLGTLLSSEADASAVADLQQVDTCQLGMDAFSLGNYPEAVDQLKTCDGLLDVTDLDHQHFLATYGASLILIGESDQGSDFLDQAYNFNPEDIDTLTKIAFIAVHLENYERAKIFSSKVIEAAPNEFSGHYNFGIASLYLGHFDEAASGLETALSLEPMQNDIKGNLGYAYLMSGRLEESERLSSAALITVPYDAQILVNLAAAQIRQGHVLSALMSARKAIAFNPESHDAFLTSAIAEAVLGNYTLAERHLDKAIVLNPTSADALAHRGNILALRGHWAKARQDLDMALQIGGLNWEQSFQFDIQFNSGIARLNSGDVTGAIPFLQKAIELQPSSATTLLYLGSAFQQIGQIRESIETFEKVLEISPVNQNEILVRAQAKSLLGRGKEAIADLTRELEASTNAGPVHNVLGKIIFDTSNCQLAVEHFEKAFDYGVRDFQSLVLSAGCHYQFRQNKQTLKVLNAAIELNPESGPVYFQRGTVNVILGAFTNALADFAKASEFGYVGMDVEMGRSTALYFLERFDESYNVLYEMIRAQPNFFYLYLLEQEINKVNQRYRILRLETQARVRQNEGVAQAHANKGYADMFFGDLEEAEQEFDLALSISPNDMSPQIGMGRLLARKLEFASAYKLAQSIIKDGRQPAEGHSIVALAALLKGDFQLAAEALEASLEIYPGNPELYPEMLRVRMRSGNPVSRPEFDELSGIVEFQSWDQALIAYLLGEIPEGDLLFEIRSIAHPDITLALCEAYYSIATMAYAQGDTDRGNEHLQLTINTDKKYYNCHILAAAELERNGLKS